MDTQIRPIGRKALCAHQDIATARDILRTWLEHYPPHPMDIERFRQVVGRIEVLLETDGGQYDAE